MNFFFPIRYYCFFIVFFFAFKATLMAGGGIMSSTSYEDEVISEFVEKELSIRLSQLRIQKEAKRKSEIRKIRDFFTQKEEESLVDLKKALYLSYQNTLNEHKAEYEERVSLAAEELNKRIKENALSHRSGKTAEVDYVVDLRKKQNGLAFLNDTKTSGANTKVKSVNVNKKVQFYVLLNMLYPENGTGVVYDPNKQAMVKLTGKSREEYLKNYTEEVFKRSNLTTKGVLLNVESIIIPKPFRDKVSYELVYEPYVAYGRELSNSALDKLLTEEKFLLDKGSSQYQFAVPGTNTNSDSNKDNRGKILDNYIDRITELLLNNSSDLNALENPEYLVRLSKLNTADKEALRKKLKASNLSPYIENGIEDYAGAKEYLQRFLIDDLSIWKAANKNIKLSLVTTSHKNTYKGKTARQVIKEKSVESNEMLVGMHFIEVNGEIEIHWAAKYGSEISYLEGIRLDDLWNEISGLSAREEFERQFGEYIGDADYGFSQVINVLQSITQSITDKKIPQAWYEGSRPGAFISGMVNGLLDELSDIPSLVSLAAEAYKTVNIFKVELVFGAFKYCFNDIYRQRINGDLQRVLDNRDDVIRAIADAGEKLADSSWAGAKKIPGMIGNYFSKLGEADWVAFYQYGYIVEQVASMFIGLGELSKIGKLGAKMGQLGKALVKTAKGNWEDAVKILDEMAEAGKAIAAKLDNAIDDLYKASLENYKAVYKSAWNITGVLLTYTSHATVYLIKYGKDQTKRNYTAFTDFIKSNLAKKEAKELLAETKGKEYYELLEDIYAKVDNEEYFSKLVKGGKDPYKLKNFLSDLLAQSDKASVHALIKRIPEKNIGDFIDDFSGNKVVHSLFLKDLNLLDAWKVLRKAGTDDKVRKGSNELSYVSKYLTDTKKSIEKTASEITQAGGYKKWVDNLTSETDKLVSSLKGSIKSTYDALIKEGLKSEVKANSIILKNLNNETVAIIHNEKLTPTKWNWNIKAPKATKVNTSEGYILLKEGNEIAFDLGFKEGRKLEAKEVNDYLVNGQGKDLDGQPYWAGTQIDEITLGKADEIIYFIENFNGGIPNPGQYASKESIKTIKELREKLAVKEAWKKTSDVPTLRAYRVKADLKCRSGVIGPQIDNGLYLPGGGHQYEIIDYLGGNWKNYLEVIIGMETKLK